MSAKSAPQLFVSRIASTLHLHAALLVIALALLTVGAGWLARYERDFVAAAIQMPSVESAAPEPAVEQAATTPVVEQLAENSRYRALSEFLAKRYRVSQTVTLDLVSIAHAAGHQVGLDPLLIIAVMAVESRFNPIAESVAGAKGLMQVIPRFHLEKFREFGGEKYAVLDPATNIFVGSHILKEYLARTGSLTSALKLYVGSSSADDDTYSEKVMTEKQRLQQVLRRSPPAQRTATVNADKLALAAP